MLYMQAPVRRSQTQRIPSWEADPAAIRINDNNKEGGTAASRVDVDDPGHESR